MRSLIIFAVSMMFFGQAAGQMKLDNISTAVGKSATSSGYDITVLFSNANQHFSVTGNSQRVYAVYSWDLPKLNMGASGGFYQNTPWLGPIVTYSPTNYLSFVYWGAVSGGLPNKPDWKARSIFQWVSADVKIGSVDACYGLLKFLDGKLDNLPGIRYTGNVNSDWSFRVGMDYDVNAEQPLFQLGLTKKF